MANPITRYETKTTVMIGSKAPIKAWAVSG